MLIYLFGKALAYASLGLIFGSLGLGLFLLEWQQLISIVAGILIIIIALFPILKIKRANSFFQNKITQLFARFMNQNKWYTKPLLGFLNGLLPCGMVYVALTTAIISGHPLSGALAMLIFGIGTMPILFAAMFFKSKLSLKLRVQLKPVTLVLSLLVGVLMILRGADLGIPIISPHLEVHEDGVEGCCH